VQRRLIHVVGVVDQVVADVPHHHLGHEERALQRVLVQIDRVEHPAL